MPYLPAQEQGCLLIHIFDFSHSCFIILSTQALHMVF